jgi:hypothetical protein
MYDRLYYGNQQLARQLALGVLPRARRCARTLAAAATPPRRSFPTCLSSPHSHTNKQVTKRSSQKVQARRSSLKTFIKVVNYNHMMPTRYTLDLDLKPVIAADAVESGTKKVEARKVRELLFFGVAFCVRA